MQGAAFSDGTRCNDGDINTDLDTCTDGVCAGRNLCGEVTCTTEACHEFTTCSRGRCIPGVALSDSTRCDDGVVAKTGIWLDTTYMDPNVVAAAGHQACEVGFSPFAVVSVDGGKTFVRRELEVGVVYSAFAMGISVSGSKVTVRVGVARMSDDDPRPVCFELDGLGAPRRLGKCPAVSAAAKVRQRGSAVLDAKGRSAKLR